MGDIQGSKIRIIIAGFYPQMLVTWGVWSYIHLDWIGHCMIEILRTNVIREMLV